ncbi:MAG: hypothetical protein QGF59_00700 [Pirellulaceae bacterium]|jgi:hypothetical protein|nr:hypothetical protein [Pirellulaceae bacterium]
MTQLPLADQPTKMNSPRITKSQRRPQISLRWFVVGVLILGPVLGIGGPIAIRIVQELRTPRPLPASSIPAAAFDPMPSDYYESGETPLD